MAQDYTIELNDNVINNLRQIVGGESGNSPFIADVHDKKFDPEAFLNILIEKGIDVDNTAGSDYNGEFAFGLYYSDIEPTTVICVKKDSDAFTLTIEGNYIGVRILDTDVSNLRDILTNEELAEALNTVSLANTATICISAFVNSPSNEVLYFNENEVTNLFK